MFQPHGDLCQQKDVSSKARNTSQQCCRSFAFVCIEIIAGRAQPLLKTVLGSMTQFEQKLGNIYIRQCSQNSQQTETVKIVNAEVIL